MSDALPLPPRPNLEQYKKLAKDLQHASRSSDPDSAVRDWAARWAPAQDLGFAWPKFRGADEGATCCKLADAQLFIARAHGFASWPKFARHVEALARENSPVSKFEEAVDAIVSGDLPGLEKLLSASPDLLHARSTREHRSTLLHYVSANGVEDFRQKTPKNVVEITKLLLKAGAEVNAESDAYRGRSTTLGLTATSCHPHNAGVQIPLMELLIERGAIIDGPDGYSGVNACLHNGRGEAAEFLANRGARLDLEGAAGVGRLDVVKSFFSEDGRLKPSATEEQMRDGFAWACEFGRISVVDFLLQRGMKVDARLRHGETGLHWAAHAGHSAIVQLLLDRGAPIEVKEERFGGTPLDWALHGWGEPERAQREPHYEIVALLARAGAKLDPGWLQNVENLYPIAEKIRSEPRMLAALRGEF
ncbi:MAG TPA: ankyrin repeat domain-containing protein [Bryobacteraceae bacterium]|nr:ankyrin repeat domain-containing protein [Bryobacteraceae bacterium]